MTTTTNTFDWAALALTPGAVVRSRTGAVYVVTTVTDKAIEAVRPPTGSSVRCSRRMVERAAAALDRGQPLAYQRSGPNGGISYTVAVEALAVACLGDRVARDDERRQWVPVVVFEVDDDDVPDESC